VSVNLVIRHSRCMCRIALFIWGHSDPTVLSHIISQMARFS